MFLEEGVLNILLCSTNLAQRERLAQLSVDIVSIMVYN